MPGEGRRGGGGGIARLEFIYNIPVHGLQALVVGFRLLTLLLFVCTVYSVEKLGGWPDELV